MIQEKAGKKIYVVIDNITTGGGIERVFSVLLKSLCNNYNIKVLGLLDSSRECIFKFPDDLEIVPLLGDRVADQKNFLISIRKAFDIINNEKPDVVLYPTMGRLSVFCAPFVLISKLKNNKIKHVSYEHINFSFHKKSIRALKKATFPVYDRVILLNERELENFGNHKKYNVIPNPMPFEKVLDGRTGIKEKLALGVGRLTAQKGFDLLIPAWADFVREHPDWKLVIVGEGEDRDKLSRMIEEYGVDESCTLYGFSKNIDDFYRRADLMLLPSRYEGFGMVLVEAQCYALPTVAFDCETGPRQIVNHGEDGYLIPPFEQAEFSRAMHRIVCNENEYARFSQNASRNVKKFDVSNIKPLWDRFLNGL